MNSAGSNCMPIQIQIQKLKPPTLEFCPTNKSESSLARYEAKVDSCSHQKTENTIDILENGRYIMRL